MKYYVGMDVGATTMRIKIADESGNILVEHEGEGGSVNVWGYDHILEVYRRELNAALAKKNLAYEDCICLCAGATGVDNEELQEIYTNLVSEIGFPRESLRMYNDCGVMVHTDESKNIIAIVAGTGSISVGRRCSDGAEARFGGHGHLLSDDGSAFYIVKEAIRKMVRYVEGYGDCEYMYNRFKDLPELEGRSVGRFYVDYCMTQKNKIADLAPLVTESAEHGDPGALEIMEMCAEGLLLCVDAVSGRLGFTAEDEVTILYWGSILEKVPMVSDRLTELIRAKFPKAEFTMPTGGAVDVALQVAMRSGPKA
jgi:N-acetylglucosamine kinase-like BadF-type ATPase